jgi:tetratricopeptide (TPR) repeat protein
MKTQLFALFLSSASLCACAGSPVQLAQQTGGEERGPFELEKITSSAKLPNQELSAKILYQVLLAEIASQRGRVNVAVATYLEVAKATKDPRLAQRATELAMYARLPQQALEGATLWSEADPESQQARQIMTSLLLSTGKLDQAKPHLQKFLAGDEKEVRQSFLGLNSLLAKHPDKAAALAMVKNLAEPFPQLAEAHYAVSVAAYNAKDMKLALAEADRVLELKPDWEQGAQLKGQLLQGEAKDQAIGFYQSFLKRNPQANDLRLAYARLLADQKEYKAARDQFNELTKAAPANPDITFAVGLLSMQIQDYAAAEGYFAKALTLSPREPDTIRMYLGQIAEDQKQFDKAVQWYKEIGPGEQFMPAQIRHAGALARQNRLEDARKHLNGVKTENEQQRIQLVLAEASLLREAKQYQQSYDLLSETLSKNPDAPEVLYDRAMAAEKLDKVDVLETDLRKLISIKPDYAHAYNALGYTLADRSIRLPEALGLIKKAVELAPEDPFILDSLGWAHYRMGNLDESVGALRKAFQMRPDPEIAAHLGEVLWVKGSQVEASKIWRTAVEANPDNEVLLAIMKKYQQQ